MGLTVGLDTGRDAFAESAHAFLRAVDSYAEYELLGASRCHGWTRMDVVVHVIAGWHEMLGGLVSTVPSEPTVDASSYWPAFASEFVESDPVPTLMAQRRRTATYARPASAIEHLHDVAASVVRGVDGMAQDRRYMWQGHVFEPGDFLAVWAVEDVVHHLDLQAEVPAPSSALHLARATTETLVGVPLPSSWSDEEAVLIGTGRRPAPDGLGAWADRLPALG